MWKDKKSFILWLHAEKERNYQILTNELKKLKYENTEREYIFSNLDEILSLQRFNRDWVNLCYSQVYKITDYENMISGQIIDYLNSIYYKDESIHKNPKLWEYEEFIICAFFIKIFENTKMSKIKKEYDRQIIQLKKKADEVSKYSLEPIIITIPRRTQEILSYLKFKLFFSDNIQNFLYFFNYSTKNITVKTYLEFSKRNRDKIAELCKLLNLEQTTAIDFLINSYHESIIINTIKLSKVQDNEFNPFFISYEAHNIGL